MSSKMDLAIEAARAKQVTDNDVWRLMTNNRPASTKQLLEMLHGTDAPDAPQRASWVWQSLTRGISAAGLGDATGGRVEVSFAGSCFIGNRLGMLRDFMEAGRPQWLDVPQCENIHRIFGYDVPVDGSPSEWLRSLCTFRHEQADTACERSLFVAATPFVTPWTPAFLEIALNTDPEHEDIALVLAAGGAGAAALTELQMRRRLAAQDLTPPDQSSQSPRRRMKV